MSIHLHVEFTLAEAKAYFLLTAQLVNMPDKSRMAETMALDKVYKALKPEIERANQIARQNQEKQENAAGQESQSFQAQTTVVK